MKILYLCFTPYHIKASNFLSKTRYKCDENHLFLSSCSGINENILKKFVAVNNYRVVTYTDIELSLRQGIREGIKYFKKCKCNIDFFMTIAVNST